MTDIADTVRVTTTSTWTELAGASGTDKTAIASGQRGFLDLTISNWHASNSNVVLLAVTADATAPSADTEAFLKHTLSAQAEGSNNHILLLERVYLPSDAHIWLKSDQDDTRVLVNGETEATS